MKANTGLSHLFAYAFATHLLFGSILVLNASWLGFFYYFPRRINIIIIDPTIDIIVWVASVVCLSILIVWSEKNVPRRVVGIGLASSTILLSMIMFLTLSGTSPNAFVVYVLYAVAIAAFVALALSHGHVFDQSTGAITTKVLIYFLVYFAAIEISSATHYVIRSFDITTQIGRMDAGIELQLSYASYGLLPWLYVGFLFSWAWVPIIQRLLTKALRLHPSPSTVKPQRLFAEGSSGKWVWILQDPRFILALAFAAFIGFYPYFHNPPWLVGTDAVWRYYSPLLRMNSNGVVGGFLQAFDERHPIALITLYAVQLLFQTTAFVAVKHAPIVLVIMLGLSTWWFLARKKSMNFGILVFVLSVLSISTTVGLNSSILSNWMAVVVWTFFFAYAAFKGSEGFRIQDGLVLFVLSTLILLIHPWTWGVFATAVLIAGIVALIQDRRNGLRSGGTLIAVILSDLLFAFLSLTFLATSQGWRVADALDYYTFVINNPSSVLYFWAAVNRLTSVWAPFYSPLYIAVGIIGVFSLTAANLSSWQRRLILAWLCVSGIGSVLIAPVGFYPTDPNSSQTELWRLLFLTPFQLTAPLGIVWLAQFPKDLLRNENAGTVLGTRLSVRAILISTLFVSGVLLAWGPIWLRFLIIVAALPIVTGLVLLRAAGYESEILWDIILLGFVVVAFNNTARALSQLLFAPHN